MRYEAKHNFFKKLAQAIGNYINLPWTLAKRHQYMQCYWNTGEESVLSAETDIGPGNLIIVACLDLIRVYSIDSI